MKRLLLFAICALCAVSAAHAQRVTDQLNRGLVAIPQGDKTGQDDRYGVSGSGIFVSWRKLATEYYDTQYNLYRDGTKLNSTPLTVSNYQDNGGKSTSKYKVVPVIRGTERTDLASAEVTPWEHQYWDIPTQPVVNRAGKTVTSQYSLNDCSVADVDGDGQMEFVVKRRNDSGLNTADNTTTFNLHECYKMDGTRLWWIDMGPNMMAGPDEQFDLILYDWDGDGKAEALMRGADNMIIHTASGKEIKIGNMSYYAPRDEYTKEGAEYLLYMNGATGEPYGWDGSDNWTPEAYPLPRFEQGESNYATVWGTNDTGHRAMKHYFGAPYLDGRNPSIFLGRGCYTRHKFCALDVDPATHKLTQRWRWNCYDGNSPWYGNGFHNFAIADVDMDGRDEIVFGSMIIDDTGYGLSTTGYGHGDAQHCGDLDPYRWGLEQFVCLEGATVPGIAYTDGMTSTLRYTTGSGADNGRCMAGNFQGTYPGAIGITFGYDAISLVADRTIDGLSSYGNDDYMNMRVYWDGDLLDEFMDSPGVERAPCVYKAPGQKEVHTGRSYANSRVWMGGGSLNNSSKNNPCFLGDIMGDWREEIVTRVGTTLRIHISSYESPWGITTLWADHEYRNGMTWQSVGYNQPPHPSFFLGELEGITAEPPALTLEGRTETTSITTTDAHLLVSGYENKTVTVADGAAPWVVTVNTPAWVKGSGSRQATSSTPKQPARTIETYTTTFTGGALGGAARLVKQGEGVLVLNNVTERHTGNTDIWQGTLQFDGTMEKSPVWLNRHTTLITKGGQFKGGLKADYNATIQVSDRLTASTLDLGFGARVVLHTDGTTDTPVFDQIDATTLKLENKGWSYGPKYKAPVLQFVLNGTLADGTYDLGSIATIDGELEEVVIEGLDNAYTTSLQHENGKLQLIVKAMRASDTVTWDGTSGNSTWEQAVSQNFVREGETTYSANGDDVVFNDNAASTDIVIKGKVSPNSVTFNNETKTYTFSGDSIVGGGTITKNGAGRVNFTNWNNTGNTVVNGGTVSVVMLANNSGQTFGSLGSANKTVKLNDGTTFIANGTIITDQQFNVSGNTTINVPSGKSIIFNKGIKGTGATINKTGAGSMEIGTSGNNYSKLVVKAGTVTSNYNSSNVDELPATVEYQGTTGVVWGANKEGTPYLTSSTDFVVPKNAKGSFYGSFGGTYKGTLTGAGTFTVYTGGVRCYFDGDWSAFEGTLIAAKNNRQNKKSYDPNWIFRNSKGLPNATLQVQKNVRADNGGTDIVLGAVSGEGSLVGSGKWILGANGEDFWLSTEVGITSSRTDDYGNTISMSATPLVKRGAGKMYITTVGNINGILTVEEGSVVFDDPQLSTNVNGSNGTQVRNGGRLVGQGRFNTVVLDSGAELMPCGSIFDEETTGTIKTVALLNAKEGSVLNFLVDRKGCSTLLPGSLTMDGTVKLTLVSGYTPKAGDAFTLWTTTGTFKGTPVFDLPTLPEGLYWDTSEVAQKTGILRVTDTQSIAPMTVDTPVSCEVFTANGVRVATLQTLRGQAVAEAGKLPLRAGTYIIYMRSGDGTESAKVLVK